jgi:putative membrane protein
MLSFILGVIIAILVSAVVIYIVGRLNLGLSVENFTSAIIAAIVIGLVSGVIVWLLGLLGISLGGPGFWAGLVSLIVSAVVLLISDRFVSGMKVSGFVGAIVAAIAIGVINWLAGWVLSLFT